MENIRCTKYYYDGSDQLIYKCTHQLENASDGDTHWEITKYTWTGSVCTSKQRLEGTVTGRASLAW
jgi:hypothetical protein